MDTHVLTTSQTAQRVKDLLAMQETEEMAGLIPGSERSPGERNGHPLQYSYLENSLDRATCWATVHGVAELDITELLTLSHFH